MAKRVTNCIECGDFIPCRIVIDGKERNLASRTRCLSCLPFKSKVKADRPTKRNRTEYHRNYFRTLLNNGINNAHMRRSELRYRVVQAFGGKCCVCGYDKRPEAMHFHHVNPEEKEFNLDARHFSINTIEEILIEAKKCVLLCGNCHNEHHMGLHHKCIEEQFKIIAKRLRNIDQVSDLPELIDWIDGDIIRTCRKSGISAKITDFPTLKSPPLIPQHYGTVLESHMVKVAPANYTILNISNHDAHKIHKQKDCIAVYSDEYQTNRLIYDSMYLMKTNQWKHRITIRPQRCVIDYNADPSDLYNSFHYLGKCIASYHIGLLYHKNLIAAMSIRRPIRQNAGDWEIARMVRNNEIYVHGLWSYLFKKAVDHYGISGKIVTYSDNRLSDGDVYQKMGFVKEHNVRHDYYWVKDGVRHHKSKLRKPAGCEITEWQLREGQGYHRVWDFGKIKWTITI